MQFEDNKSAISTGKFRRFMAIMNLVAIAQFLEAICTSIFKRFFAVRYTKSGLLGPVSTYFGIVKINSWEILHSHFLMYIKGYTLR